MASGYLHFGWEAFGLVQQGPLGIIIGNGQQDCLISRISGEICAAPIAPITDNAIHQYLISMKTVNQAARTYQLDPATPTKRQSAYKGI